jgi:hypothetical protein
MIPIHTFPLLSCTFGIPARLAHNPKMPKEHSSPSRFIALSAYPDKTKIGGKMTRKWLIMSEAQCLTANISKLGVSGLRKVSTFIQNRNGLIGRWHGNPSLLILANR